LAPNRPTLWSSLYVQKIHSSQYVLTNIYPEQSYNRKWTYTSTKAIREGNLLFLAASTECFAGSNDHFVVLVLLPRLVQFDGTTKNCAITQPCKHKVITQPSNKNIAQSRKAARAMQWRLYLRCQFTEYGI
jgi:hypothetical protein